MKMDAENTRWLVVHPNGDEDTLAIRSSGRLVEGDAIAANEFFDTPADAIRQIEVMEKSWHRVDTLIDMRWGRAELDRRDGAGGDLFYAVVFSGGSTEELAVVTLQDFDVLDLHYAYPFSFGQERDADRKAKDIAGALGLRYESELKPERPSF